MNYHDPSQQHQPAFWYEEPGTPRWAKVVAGLIVVAGVLAAIAIYVSRESGSSDVVADSGAVHAAKQASPLGGPEPKQAGVKTDANALPPATKGTPSGDGGGSRGFLGPEADSSFQTLAASVPARLGLVVQPLGGGAPREFGDFPEGHAWSSIKVPILATLLREQGEALGPEEAGWARSAITSSDNEAAASLFGRIEESHGGLTGASQAVEAVLHEAGSASTLVATAPPPPGAVSTYGQTEWSLLDAAQFFTALGRCEVLGPAGTGLVESLMEEVISEQRWGLGEAGFPAGWRVAMKGGWGPEAEAGGGYLVRQSGLVQDGNGGVAVAMIAMDESGSYPTGAADLTKMAQWLAGELHGLGPAYAGCAG
jgi:beta-lactamase class A